MNGEHAQQAQISNEVYLIFNTWSNTMKRIFVKLFTAFSLTMAVASVSAKADSATPNFVTPFKKGVHYTTLKKQFPEESTLREVFSVYCPHCFKLEPIIQTIKPNLLEYVKVKRHHVDFLRSAKTKEQEDVTKAIMLAEKHKVSEDMIGFTFTAIHQHRQLPERSGLENWLITLGVPETEVKGVWSDVGVAKEQEYLKMMQNEWIKSGDIKGVPTLVVNGKYRIEFSGIKATNNEDLMVHLTDLINYLALLN